MNLALSNEEINAILESADSEFMTEEEVFVEYENAGKKKINKKLLGLFNEMLPPIKRLKDALDGGKISPKEVDDATRRLSVIYMIPTLGGRKSPAAGVQAGQISGGLTILRWILKKGSNAKEKNMEYSADERKVLKEAIDAIDKWKADAQLHRDGRTLIQKYADVKGSQFFRSLRDVRELDGIRKSTDNLAEKLEAAKKMVSGHYYAEGYDFTTDDDFGYVIAD